MRLLAAGAAVALLAAAGPETGLRLVGPKPATLSRADLQAMPQHAVESGFDGMGGHEQHRWSGVLLWDVIKRLAPEAASGGRAAAGHALLVEGADHYRAIVALGEADPALEGKSVLLALEADGAPLTAPRLVVPGDRHGPRQVRDVVSLTFE